MPRRILILAEGHFSPVESKTANCVIRFCEKDVVGVIDSKKTGKTAQKVLGFGGNIPIVKDLKSALRLHPTEVLVGVAPRGGMLELKWKKILLGALRNGINVVNGMHEFLSDIPLYQKVAKKGGAKIIDLRKYERPLRLPNAKPPKWRAKVVLTVGSDCNSGKMTISWALVQALKELRIKAEFVATGQTGIYISGDGVPVDAIKSDFIAGAIEEHISRKARRADMIIVEGQGSINHPAYSAVALGLLHGARPDALILCHEAGRTKISGYPSYKIPPSSVLIDWHEKASAMVKPSRVIAVALNSSKLSESKARDTIRSLQNETGVPVFDPIRFGTASLGRVVRELL